MEADEIVRQVGSRLRLAEPCRALSSGQPQSAAFLSQIDLQRERFETPHGSPTRAAAFALIALESLLGDCDAIIASGTPAEMVLERASGAQPQGFDAPTRSDA